MQAAGLMCCGSICRTNIIRVHFNWARIELADGLNLKVVAIHSPHTFALDVVIEILGDELRVMISICDLRHHDQQLVEGISSKCIWQ